MEKPVKLTVEGSSRFLIDGDHMGNSLLTALDDVYSLAAAESKDVLIDKDVVRIIVETVFFRMSL